MPITLRDYLSQFIVSPEDLADATTKTRALINARFDRLEQKMSEAVDAIRADLDNTRAGVQALLDAAQTSADTQAALQAKLDQALADQGAATQEAVDAAVANERAANEAALADLKAAADDLATFTPDAPPTPEPAAAQADDGATVA